MSSQTEPAPASDERVLEDLEAAFLLRLEPWPLPPRTDLAEALSPAIGQVDDEPACRVTRIRTGKACCD
jgi:hypothetical protein